MLKRRLSNQIARLAWQCSCSLTFSSGKDLIGDIHSCDLYWSKCLFHRKQTYSVQSSGKVGAVVRLPAPGSESEAALGVDPGHSVARDPRQLNTFFTIEQKTLLLSTSFPATTPPVTPHRRQHAFQVHQEEHCLAAPPALRRSRCAPGLYQPIRDHRRRLVARRARPGPRGTDTAQTPRTLPRAPPRAPWLRPHDGDGAEMLTARSRMTSPSRSASRTRPSRPTSSTPRRTRSRPPRRS